LVYLVKKY